HTSPSAPSLSLLTMPPPPRSTLFPYTTLFRSQHHRRTCAIVGRAGRVMPRVVMAAEYHDLIPFVGAGNFSDRVIGRRPFRILFVDRKSTRLNSSHQIISYAVFCLKKKISI